MKKYLKYIKPYAKFYITGPIFMMVEVLGEILLPWLLAKIINIGVANHDISYIIKIGIIMVVTAIFMAAGGVMGAFFAAKAAMNTGTDLRMALFEKIQKFSFNNIDNFSTGSLVTRLTNDITQIQNMIMQTLRTCLRSPGILIGAVIMAFVMNAKLAIILIVAIPLIIMTVAVIMKVAFPRFDAMQTKLDMLNSCIQEGLVNIRVIKSFVRDEHEMVKFEQRSSQLAESTTNAMKTVIFMAPLMALIMNMAIVAVVWMGGNMIIAGNMPVGNLTAFINYMTQILSSLTMLSMVFLNSTRAVASLKRIDEVLEAEIDLSDDDARFKDKKVESGEVEFRNVFFKYYKTSDEWVLDNISFKLASGQTMGIIGSTGCGKSTLVSLVARLYDTDRGSVLVDGINVRDYSLKNLREGVGMVLQKNTLFSGDIMENLRWGDENASDEEVINAAELAQAATFIQNFEKGYETQLGQGGNNVSGGQKQRLCIARALLKKPSILIFDDSTSAVDTATERRIHEVFTTTLKDVTKIIVSQRISSIKDADIIIAMDNGVIVDMGTHEELIKSCEMYNDICRSQMTETE